MGSVNILYAYMNLPLRINSKGIEQTLPHSTESWKKPVFLL